MEESQHDNVVYLEVERGRRSDDDRVGFIGGRIRRGPIVFLPPNLKIGSIVRVRLQVLAKRNATGAFMYRGVLAPPTLSQQCRRAIAEEASMLLRMEREGESLPMEQAFSRMLQEGTGFARSLSWLKRQALLFRLAHEWDGVPKGMEYGRVIFTAGEIRHTTLSRQMLLVLELLPNADQPQLEECLQWMAAPSIADAVQAGKEYRRVQISDEWLENIERASTHKEALSMRLTEGMSDAEAEGILKEP